MDHFPFNALSVGVESEIEIHFSIIIIIMIKESFVSIAIAKVYFYCRQFYTGTKWREGGRLVLMDIIVTCSIDNVNVTCHRGWECHFMGKLERDWKAAANGL